MMGKWVPTNKRNHITTDSSGDVWNKLIRYMNKTVALGIIRVGGIKVHLLFFLFDFCKSIRLIRWNTIISYLWGVICQTWRGCIIGDMRFNHSENLKRKKKKHNTENYFNNPHHGCYCSCEYTAEYGAYCVIFIAMGWYEWDASVDVTHWSYFSSAASLQYMML